MGALLMPFPGATCHCFLCQIRANLLPTLAVHRSSHARHRRLAEVSQRVPRYPRLQIRVSAAHRLAPLSPATTALLVPALGSRPPTFRGRLDTGRVSLSRVGACAQNANTKLAVGQHLLEFILIQIEMIPEIN